MRTTRLAACVLLTLAAAGYPVDWSDELPGYRRFYTHDPHGNRLEFLTVRSDHGHSLSN